MLKKMKRTHQKLSMIYRKKLTQFYEKEGCEIILAIDELSVSSAPVVSKRFNWTLLSTPDDGINLVFAFNPFPKKILPMDLPKSDIVAPSRFKSAQLWWDRMW